jgi:YVTN family beta-propeller protein
MAVTPDGSAVFVSNSNGNSVSPINTATETAGAPISVGRVPEGIAIS